MTKRRKISKKTKRKTASHRRFLLTKPFVFSLSVMAALLIVIYATYAWNTSAKEKDNHFEGTRLSAKIVETFVPNLQWQAGTTTQKVIQVTNNGEAAAFVRLSLYEYLLAFQVDVEDQTGNGNLVIVDQAKDPQATFANFKDWQTVAQSHGTYQSNDSYQVAETAIVPTVPEGRFRYPETSERQVSALGNIQLVFDEAHFFTQIPESQQNYWLYEDGYFYYSEVLYPGETTTPLTKEWQLSSSLPNRYKGALYTVDVNLDAVDIFEDSLSYWQITSSSPVYTMWQDKVVK